MITGLTVFALFFDDIRILSIPKSGDNIANIVTITVLLTFSCDIIISCIALDEYVFSFFFWLDIISTVSLLADITWIMDGVTDTTLTTQATTLAKASRAARVTRVIRIVRLIRLARMVKIYK